MRIVETTSQTNNSTRWVLQCPRGEVLVDEDRAGRLEVTHGLRARGVTARDRREALALVRRTIDDEANGW